VIAATSHPAVYQVVALIGSALDFTVAEIESLEFLVLGDLSRGVLANQLSLNCFRGVALGLAVSPALLLSLTINARSTRVFSLPLLPASSRDISSASQRQLLKNVQHGVS
jgi:hypothetical protein